MTVAPVWAQGVDSAVETANPYQTESTWQLSLDVIKAKAEHLVVINRQLTVEHHDLVIARDKIKEAAMIAGQQNAASAQFLRERNGRSDQQVLLDDIRAKVVAQKQQGLQAQQQVNDLDAKSADLVRKMNIMRFRIADWEIRKKAKEEEIEAKKTLVSVGVPSDEEIGGLRREIEKQKASEAALEAQINELTKESATSKFDVNNLRQSNAQLQAQVEAFTKEINFRLNNPVESAVNRDKYQGMINRKHELEAKIRQYEARINALKNPANFSLSWDKEKKRMVHEMVQADATNQQLRSKVENLKEDINVLRDQVAKLERRISFGQGKGYDKDHEK